LQKDWNCYHTNSVLGLKSSAHNLEKRDIQAKKTIDHTVLRRLFQLDDTCYNTRGHKYKLKKNRSRLDIQKFFFSNRVVSVTIRPVVSHSGTRETIVAEPYQSITTSFCMRRDRDAEDVDREETNVWMEGCSLTIRLEVSGAS